MLLLLLLSRLQSCPTLCDPIDGRPPGSSVPGILQARTLEWVAIFFSNAWKWKVKVKLLSCVLLLATPWTAAYQAPLSMGFSRQEYWSGFLLAAPPCQALGCYSFRWFLPGSSHSGKNRVARRIRARSSRCPDAVGGAEPRFAGCCAALQGVCWTFFDWMHFEILQL